MPCGRWLNGGALSLSEERPSATTNIASIRTYCTRPESESGKVWRQLDFVNLNMALAHYVKVAATALYPRYAELAETNRGRMVRWEVGDIKLFEIVPDATVLSWIAEKFPKLDQGTPPSATLYTPASPASADSGQRVGGSLQRRL